MIYSNTYIFNHPPLCMSNGATNKEATREESRETAAGELAA